jgi:hypothetical protein
MAKIEIKNNRKFIKNVREINKRLNNAKKGDCILVIAHDYKDALSIKMENEGNGLVQFGNEKDRNGITYLLGKLEQSSLILSKDETCFDTMHHIRFSADFKSLYKDYHLKNPELFSRLLPLYIRHWVGKTLGKIQLSNCQSHILHLNEPIKSGSKILNLEVFAGKEAEERLKNKYGKSCYDILSLQLDKKFPAFYYK